MFLFSSRRRHTRLQGDWSSDVCSSDLLPPISFRQKAAISGACGVSECTHNVFARIDTSAPSIDSTTPFFTRRSTRLAISRSEEHTSELQSPCNLVCRLLLEKKNRQAT